MQTAASPHDSQPGSPLGQLLRGWRTERRLSQMELALRAGFSTRHLSFIETGRTQPSRQALIVLADALDVPLRERNRLLEAGGYARMYRQTPLGADEMGHVRGVLKFILDRHEPFPALVLDRYANCLVGNQASGRLVRALVDPSIVTEHANHWRILFHPLGARRWIVNWKDVARHMLARADRELGAFTGDGVAAALLNELHEYAGDLASEPRPQTMRAADLLLPVHIRTPDIELRIFTTIMTLGTPQDVTLQELRIETFFPADQESEAAWKRLSMDGDRASLPRM